MGNEELKSGSEKLKPCPFCGSEVVYMTLFTGMKMFYCKNHKDCGAVVSFDNPACNRSRADMERISAWNRRAGENE